MKLPLGLSCCLPLGDGRGGEFPCLFIPNIGWVGAKIKEKPGSCCLVMLWEAVSFGKVSDAVWKGSVLAGVRGRVPSSRRLQPSSGQQRVSRVGAGC